MTIWVESKSDRPIGQRFEKGISRTKRFFCEKPEKRNLPIDIKMQQYAAQFEKLFVQTPFAQIRWLHHIELMNSKVKDIAERL